MIYNYPLLKYYVYLNTCLLVGVVFLNTGSLLAQNQKLADSLEQIYNSGEFREEERLELLYDLAVNHPDPDEKLHFTEILLDAAIAARSDEYIFNAYLQKGTAQNVKGDLSEALQSYLKGLELAEKNESVTDLGRIYIAMAGTYSSMENVKSAIDYYNKAIDILRQTGDSLHYATALVNLGDEYLKISKPDSALPLFIESEAIFRALDFKNGIAFNLGNEGLAYAQKGDNRKAEEYISNAIEILEELSDYYPISVYLTYMSDIYADREDWDAAFTYARKSLDLATRYGLKEQISDAYLKLSELSEITGDKEASFSYFKDYVAFRDSVKNIAEVQQMADLRTDFEVAQKQVEVDLLNQQKKTQRIVVIAVIVALLLIGLLAVGLYKRNRLIKETSRIIEEEKNKSDNLLKNILPENTARELKFSGKVQAKKIDEVTVMFTDFKGFTRHSENLSPEALVDTVDYYFSKFDEIILKYGLEKIKTIGDAYMCAAGLHNPAEEQAVNVVHAAFEILAFVNSAKKDSARGKVRFDVRIGINTGTVVAGVVGTNKFAYDIWGDTVNIASRMESNSEPGKINVSENTYQHVRHAFECEYRGEIDVKNKGMMNMYFVNRPVAATDLHDKKSAVSAGN